MTHANTASSTDRIEKLIDLKAPIERVWRALTDHQEFGTWFGVKLESPFVPGQTTKGKITIPGFEHAQWEAKVVTMDQPHVFSMHWHPYAIDPKVDYSAETPTLITFKLEPTATGTRLMVVESGFDSLPSHRRADALRANTGGWEAQLRNIQAHVER